MHIDDLKTLRASVKARVVESGGNVRDVPSLRILGLIMDENERLCAEGERAFDAMVEAQLGDAPQSIEPDNIALIGERFEAVRRELEAHWPSLEDMPDGVDVFADKYGEPSGKGE